jgi:dTDP-glucose 4,6-dehydratase
MTYLFSMKTLVTGGNGFIGSNFIELLLKDPNNDYTVVNLDKETYAGKGKNIEYMGLENNPNYFYEKGDIANKHKVREVFQKYKPDIVFNFAAESHVDRSINSSEDFVKSNVLGTVNLMDSSLENKVSKFVQVSTDEVYGSKRTGSFSEYDNLRPRSPYAASKASADSFALSYFTTHKLPVVVTRSANNYGPFQFPEKLLPLFITNLIEGKKVPLMWSDQNPGLNVRDWLHVRDNSRAILHAGLNGKPGEIYNIPGENERENVWITWELLNEFRFDEKMIKKVEHRKGHDFRYSITGDKIKHLGFEHEFIDLEQGIKNLVKWYKSNQDWWKPLKD